MRNFYEIFKQKKSKQLIDFFVKARGVIQKFLTGSTLDQDCLTGKFVKISKHK